MDPLKFDIIVGDENKLPEMGGKQEIKELTWVRGSKVFTSNFLLYVCSAIKCPM